MTDASYCGVEKLLAVINQVCYAVGIPGGASDKEPACQRRRWNRHGFNSWDETIPWRRTKQPTPVFLPGESHGQRSLEGYSPRGLWMFFVCLFVLSSSTLLLSLETKKSECIEGEYLNKTTTFRQWCGFHLKPGLPPLLEN